MLWPCKRALANVGLCITSGSLIYTILKLLLIALHDWHKQPTGISSEKYPGCCFSKTSDRTRPERSFHFCAAGEKVFFLLQVCKARRRIRGCDEERPKQVCVIAVGVLLVLGCSSKALKMRGSKNTNRSSGWHCALIKELKANTGRWMSVCVCVRGVFYRLRMVKNTTFIFLLRKQRL